MVQVYSYLAETPDRLALKHRLIHQTIRIRIRRPIAMFGVLFI